MTRCKRSLRFLALFLIFCLLATFAPFAFLQKAETAEQTPVSAVEMAGKAVEFIKQEFLAGEKIDGYTAYVLTTAGEDLSAAEWVYNGNTLKDTLLASVAATIANPSSVTTGAIAHQLLAVNQWTYQGPADQLADILRGRQKDNGSFDNNIFVDMPAFEALGKAGRINVINAVYARDYILGSQHTGGDNDGSWGGVWPDLLVTAQAIRALTYLPGASGDDDLQAAITRGLDYLKRLQKTHGGVYEPFWGDPAVDNSETIITLRRLGKDPAGAEWTKTDNGITVNPVTYLMTRTMNPDGSFGTIGNVFGASRALLAYVLQQDADHVPDSVEPPPVPPPSGNQPAPPRDQFSVNIAVVGENGELLYGPGSVLVSKTGKWGLTALGALHATGLTYTENGGFVNSIAGQANRGAQGWMYKVNETIPPKLASAKLVNEGDRVIWWYSKDVASPGPTWDSFFRGIPAAQQAAVAPVGLREQNRILPLALQASDEALAALERAGLLPELKEKAVELARLNEETSAVALTGSLPPLDLAAITALRKELAQNTVNITRMVAAASGGTVADAGAEVALSIPARALTDNVEITVKKALTGDDQATGAHPAAPSGFRLVSAMYDFGPDGTVFVEPATLTLRIAIPPLVRPENLVLARYDKAAGTWVAIPAVVDISRGLILARVQRFSHYAVFARELLKPFDDVTPASYGWAKGSIEALAGAGIVAGVNGTRFEPARAVTRAEFAALLVRALGLQARAGATQPFKDVRSADWHYGAVTAAYAAGLIAGFADNTFRPDSAITRQEVAALLVRAMKLQDTEKKLSFTDSDKIAAWARTSVAAAASLGLIRGFPDGSFQPQAATSRAQCAVIIYRLLTN